MEGQQRKDWGTVSLGNYTTYDVFSLTDVMTREDLLTFEKHKNTFECEASLKLCHVKTMWPDVFIAPTIEELLGMRVYEIHRLIRNVLIPHIYSFLVPWGAKRRLNNRLDIFRRALTLGDFDIEYANGGQFLVAVQTLARTPGGERIASDLSKAGARCAFEDLLPSAFLDKDDYVDSGDIRKTSPNAVNLFMKIYCSPVGSETVSHTPRIGLRENIRADTISRGPLD